jgi:hypothetical protein
MATTIGNLITSQVITLLTGTSGVNSYLSGYTQDNGQPLNPLNSAQVRAQNVAPDIADKSMRWSFLPRTCTARRLLTT